MGLLDVATSILGDGGAGKLGEAQTRAAQMGEERLNALSGRYDPMANQLNPAINYMSAGATPGGYGQQLDEIQQSPLYELIHANYQKGVNDNLAAGGQLRSGYGADLSGKTGMETLLNLGDQFQSRNMNMANIGMQGLNAQSDLGQQGINMATSGIIGPAQTNATASQGMLNLIGSLGGSAIGGMFGSGGMFGAKPQPGVA